MDKRNVWQTLSAINVNEHTNKKGQFTYLSWNWAWATVMEAYPDSSYAFRDSTRHEDGSLEVWCEVTIEGVIREMWLAVTDHRNQPIKNPSCDHVANARMRCLVKAIAMHGLGFYIYAGEGLPMEVYEPPFTDEQQEIFDSLIATDDAVGLLAFSIDNTDAYINLANTAPKGEKVTFKKTLAEMIKRGNDELSHLVMAINETAFEDDMVTFEELTEDMPPAIKKMVSKKLSPETHQFIKDNK